MWPNSSAPNFSSPWDLATRLPALRGSVLFLTAILAVLTVLMALLESDPTERLLALLWTTGSIGGSAVLVVWLAWRPVDAWQRIRGALPEGTEVVRVELRVLNWDVFKQRGWRRFVDSPWNGPYNEAALLVLPDRLVMMGIKGVPFPTSRHGLPVHPVELLPDGDTPPQFTAIPAVRVLPVWSRDGRNTTIPDRYRVIDPAHEGELTLVIKSDAHLFHDRFGRAGTQKAD